MTALLLLGLPALAFQQAPDVHIGQEPLLVRRTHLERQHALRHGKVWQSFTAGEGSGWQARFDEWTGLPYSAWGPGIQLADASNAAAVDAGIRAFFDRNPGLTGVSADALALGRAHYNADNNQWIVRYDQVLPGSSLPEDPSLLTVPGAFEHFASHGQPVVWRGGVKVSLQHGRITHISVSTQPDATVANPSVSAAEAISQAIAQGPEPLAPHVVEGAVLVVIPFDGDEGRTSRTTWMVRSTTEGEPPGRWVSFVDVETGNLVRVYNEVRFLDGTLSAEHDTRTVNGDMSVSPMEGIRVVGAEGGAAYTNASGAFSVAGAASAGLTDGEDFGIYNADGAEAELSWSESSVTWTDADATLAELDTYVFLTMVQSWATIYANDIGIVQDGMFGQVNIDSACNAYYDGNVNFYQAGSGCNNTGRIKDVVFHEWGHGMHYYAAASSYIDGSLGEGVADVVSILETEDSVMAPYFSTDGSGIRNADNRLTWPDSYRDGDVHHNGQMYSGSIWDWWGIARAELGDEAAHELVSTLVVDAMQYNPTIDQTYDATVLADDDDGDLSNGTPHLCDIIEGFGNHGFGPAGSSGGGTLSLSHDAIANQPASATSYAVAADLINAAPECFEASADDAVVVWSLDGGTTWEETPLTVDADSVEGAIPQAPAGSIVTYYLRAGSDSGDIFLPSGGLINPMSFAVGDLTEIYCEDFEGDDGGYTSELLAGENTEGANDWQWGRPLGEGGDPDFAFSGNRVWGNDLGADNYNGEYQNDRHNRLTSVEIDVSGQERVVLQYRRWLNMEDSYYDQANILANGEVVWTNHGTDRDNGVEHTMDRQWVLHTVELPVADDTLQLAWEIITDGGLTMGGWNIDDVCVYGIEPLSDVEPDPEDTGDTGEADTDTDTPDGTDSGEDTVGGVTDGDGKISGCACTTTDNAPGTGILAVVGLLGLVGLRRRRDD